MQSDFLLLRLVPRLLDTCWKSLLVFALAGVALPLMRRGSAAGRHALWLSVFVALLCLPALCLWLPPRALPLLPAAAVVRPAPALPSTAPAEVPAFPVARALPMPPVTAKAPASAPSFPPAPPESRPDIPVSPAAWLALLWLVGAAAALARTALGLASARRLVRGCIPVDAGPLAEAAQEARRMLGVTRPVLLRQDTSGAVAVPMTFGARRPVVLLPGGAPGWPPERARVVLLHEMAHVGRGDWAALVLAQVVAALYWFHPLVWLAARRLRAEAEEACDDRVLACGVPAPDYAGHLLEIVRAMPRRGGVPVAAVVTMARTREIADRLETILAPAKDRQPLSRRRLALALLAGLVLVVPLAAMHPARRHSPARVGAVAKVTGAPWTARLSDGTLIKLVAVSRINRHGRDIGVPWAPGGGPISGRAAIRSPLVAMVDPMFDGIGDLSLRLAATPPRSYKAAVVSESNIRRGHYNIGLSFSSGSFTTLVSAPLGQSASRRLPSGETVVLSKGPAGPQVGPLGGKILYLTQIRLTIPVRFNTSDYDSKMEALGEDGKPAAITSYFGGSAEGSGATRRLSYNYRPSDLKSNHIAGFRFVTRPAEHFTFRDVALYPTPPAGAALPVSQEFDSVDKDPAVRARARRQRIEAALALRARLQGWAERNAAALRQMRQAGPDDLVALMRVYDQVPRLNTSTPGVTFCTLGAPPTLFNLRQSRGPLAIGLREGFARRRDLRLFYTLGGGRASIALWASGRVSETESTYHSVASSRGEAETIRETAEIAPAYPFLK